MGKLSALAERIADTKTRLEVEADKLAVKLDVIDAAAPKAFDRGHAFLDAQAAEVQEIEDTLRQLSNLPFDSKTSLNASGRPAGELKSSAQGQLPPGGAAAQAPFPSDPSGTRT